MDFTHVIVWGCVGGVLPDVVRLIKGRFGDIPGYLKSPMFWVGLVLLVALGGFVSWLGTAKEVKEALAFGYAGPEGLSRLLGVKEEPGQQDRGAGSFQLRRFWSK
jgi:hypothetical protein